LTLSEAGVPEKVTINKSDTNKNKAAIDEINASKQIPMVRRNT